MELQAEYRGKVFRVVHCKNALDTYEALRTQIPKSKYKSLTTQMILQIQRLADGGRMSGENFVKEGKLPSQNGKSKHFYALKRIPIRGYCWLSEKHPNTYFISHYMFKKAQKLKERDITIVSGNWRRIEENGYEN